MSAKSLPSWTNEELRAMAQDEDVIRKVSEGMQLKQAAHEYMRSQKATRERSVPTTKASSAAGGETSENYIESMTNEQFAAFRERVRKARLQGKQVRL